VTFSKAARLLAWEDFALEPNLAIAEETFESVSGAHTYNPSC
jgi:hypothetical protein